MSSMVGGCGCEATISPSSLSEKPAELPATNVCTPLTSGVRMPETSTRPGAVGVPMPGMRNQIIEPLVRTSRTSGWSRGVASQKYSTVRPGDTPSCAATVGTSRSSGTLRAAGAPRSWMSSTCREACANRAQWRLGVVWEWQLRKCATLIRRLRRVGSDDRQRLTSREVEREQCALVVQQDESGRRRLAQQSAWLGHGHGRRQLGIAKDAHAAGEPNDAQHGLVDHRLRHLTRANRLRQWFAEALRPTGAGQLHVEAGERRGRPYCACRRRPR